MRLQVLEELGDRSFLRGWASWLTETRRAGEEIDPWELEFFNCEL
jgi:hypothetical protein